MLQKFQSYSSLLFVLVGLLFTTSLSAQFKIPPKPDKANPDAVYDYAGLLSKSQKANLENKLIKYSDTTSTQIVIVTIKSLQGESIGMLTPKWGHAWGIGQAEEDNGVIILLAEQERKIWISPGYGAENKLTAGIVGEITRNRIIPYFKRGDYYGGLDAGVNSIFEVLNGEFQGSRQSGEGGFPFGVIIFLVIFFIIFVSAIANNKRNGGNNRGGGRSTGNDLLDIIILSNLGRGSFGGGGSSGGGFSGGGGFGGGFGGGGFSGGGAGGSW